MIFPAIATTPYGLIIAELMMTSHRKPYKTKVIACMGVAFLSLGVASESDHSDRDEAEAASYAASRALGLNA